MEEVVSTSVLSMPIPLELNTLDIDLAPFAPRIVVSATTSVPDTHFSTVTLLERYLTLVVKHLEVDAV